MEMQWKDIWNQKVNHNFKITILVAIYLIQNKHEKDKGDEFCALMGFIERKIYEEEEE